HSLLWKRFVRRSSYDPVHWVMMLQTSSLVTWSKYEMPRILRKYLISTACIFRSSSTCSIPRCSTASWVMLV
uniref:Uncharacterized protein n=1 Tax=Terrapene triunguis TaxID=2587831 RepID=A0A674J9N0_9SAUR